ncbi:MAG: carotenoid oxygenase family protein [Planctomycetota bacterium]
MNRLSRRDFVRSVLAAGVLGTLERPLVALALRDVDRLSFRANRTAGAEGRWVLRRVEGEIPKDLNGTLYRTAPGLSENHGVLLRHIFDGDAYASGWSFREGRAWMGGRFVATPEREEELAAGRMMFSEFGTNPPGKDGGPAARRPDKNQPSVNLVHWDGRLLGLSEGGHPTALDPRTLAYHSRWDFHGTLPQHSFTAHPKFDLTAGVGYGWGLSYRQGPALEVYRLEPNGRVAALSSVPMKGSVMVHDVALTENFLVFLIPSLHFDRSSMQKRDATPADALTFDPERPIDIVVLSRETGELVVRGELPPGVLYHHGNAFEEGTMLTIDTYLSDDNRLNELLESFSADELLGSMASAATRLVIDLETGELVEKDVFGEHQEFPRFDERRSGEDLRYVYSAEASGAEDPLVFTHLARFDLHRGRVERVPAGNGRALGEPVFVPRQDAGSEPAGWTLQLGYDGPSDTSFLEIRDADSLDLAARVWAPTHVPLGFHGNFAPNVYLDAPG